MTRLTLALLLLAGPACAQTVESAGPPGPMGPASTVPNVESQAISPSGALAGLLFSTQTAPTTTTVAGVTALAGVGGLGGAGAVVMVRACGS